MPSTPEPVHPDEAATVRAFISPPRRERWLGKLAAADRRRFLDRLDHCPDFDGRLATPLDPGAGAAAALRSLGAPATCRVLCGVAGLDARELPLDEAVDRGGLAGRGFLLSCIPGRLAYHQGEAGTGRRLVLRK